ncbi:MAG TPA: hypothetical protein VLF59_02720 [Candidatus Saccharimonadales bacterium]|nr:hypothetical protein [Candidatus Saccharimonadales bacterium]
MIAPGQELTFTSEPIDIPEDDVAYKQARLGYFARIAWAHIDVWQQHYDNRQFDVLPAHLPGIEEPKEICALPSVRHCLVEGARAAILGTMLGLEGGQVHDLQKAAVLHDSFKGQEVVRMLEQKPSWDSYAEAQVAAHDSWLATPGRFSEDVIDIASSVAHESISDMEELLAKSDDELTDLDKAKLAMHYLDDYTVEDYWAEPAVDGQNDLDRRMTKNENNERYRALNEAGREYFDGETAYQAQRRNGHAVETRLAALIKKAQGLPEAAFEAIDLPVIIDNNIKQALLVAREAVAGKNQIFS